MSVDYRSAIIYGIVADQEYDIDFNEFVEGNLGFTEFLYDKNIDYIADYESGKIYIGLIISDMDVDSIPTEIDYKLLDTYDFEYRRRIAPQIAKYLRNSPPIALRHIMYTM